MELFGTLQREKDGEKNKRKRRIFFYSGIKKQWQQLYIHEALNPVFMQVSVLLYVLGHGAFAQQSGLFLLFFRFLFLAKP